MNFEDSWCLHDAIAHSCLEKPRFQVLQHSPSGRSVAWRAICGHTETTLPGQMDFDPVMLGLIPLKPGRGEGLLEKYYHATRGNLVDTIWLKGLVPGGVSAHILGGRIAVLLSSGDHDGEFRKESGIPPYGYLHLGIDALICGDCATHYFDYNVTLDLTACTTIHGSSDIRPYTFDFAIDSSFRYTHRSTRFLA